MEQGLSAFVLHLIDELVMLNQHGLANAVVRAHEKTLNQLTPLVPEPASDPDHSV